MSVIMMTKTMLSTTIYLVLLISFTTGLQVQVFDACDTDEECPEGSICSYRGCDGKLCLCPDGLLPDTNKTSCINGMSLGSQCTPRSACQGQPYSECINNVCQCKDGYRQSDSSIGLGIRCLPKSLGTDVVVELGDYNDTCDGVERDCSFDLDCRNGVCLCPKGSRIATKKELAASPYSYFLCRPASFQLGAQVNTSSEECRRAAITTAKPSVIPPTVSSTSTSTFTSPATSQTTSQPTTSPSTTLKPTTTPKVTTTPKPTTPTSTTSKLTTTPEPTTSTSTTTTPKSTKATTIPTTTRPVPTTPTTTLPSTKPTTTMATTTTTTIKTTTKGTSTRTTSKSTTSSPSTTTVPSTKPTTLLTKTSTLSTSTRSTSTPSTPIKTSPMQSPTTSSRFSSKPTLSIETKSTVKASTSTTKSEETLSMVTATTETSSANLSGTTTVNTVNIGDNCAGRMCPNNSNCEKDTCGERRCRCNLGYTESVDTKSCLKLSALGESCRGARVCQGPFTECTEDGICDCQNEYERSDTGKWCRLQSRWLISFPLLGESCTKGFFSSCYMYFEQECVSSRCKCKNDGREVGDEDRHAMYPDIRQCRNSTYIAGERDKDICKNQSRQSFTSDIYERAKAKIRKIQGAIIGGSVGFLVLVGIVIGLVVLIRWKRRGKRQIIRDTSSTASSERYSIKIPRPFTHYLETTPKEYDSQQIAYPNPVFQGEGSSIESRPDLLTETGAGSSKRNTYHGDEDLIRF